MMQNTLYQLQMSYYQQDKILSQLQQIIQPQDSILLLGDGIFSIQHPILSTLAQNHRVYILHYDEKIYPKYPDFIHILDEQAWVDLILTHQRCISLK